MTITYSLRKKAYLLVYFDDIVITGLDARLEHQLR